MAVFPQLAALIVREHRHKPIQGDILLIGRQTVCLTVAQAEALLRREGVEPRPGHLVETDGRGFISDKSFLSMLSDGRVIAIDVDDYEGAEIVHDLNTEIPERFHNIADFIFNGSVSDDVFEPAMVMRSVSKMLRPGGRILDIEAGIQANGPISMFAPEWFFDFYAINNYADCQTFCCTCADWSEWMNQTWEVHWWRPFYYVGDSLCVSFPNPPLAKFVNVILAEKGADSTNDAIPIKAMYRLLHKTKNNPQIILESGSSFIYDAIDQYTERYHAYLRSPRTLGFASGFESLPPWGTAPGDGQRPADRNRVTMAAVGTLPHMAPPVVVTENRIVAGFRLRVRIARRVASVVMGAMLGDPEARERIRLRISALRSAPSDWRDHP